MVEKKKTSKVSKKGGSVKGKATVKELKVGDLFQPLNGNILLLRDTVNKEEKTAGGIIIPTSAKKKQPDTAKVMAIAKDVTAIKVGETVVVGTWSGTQIELQEETYSVVEVNMVLGIFKG